MKTGGPKTYSMEEVFRTIPLGVLVFDADTGKFVEGNPAAHEMLRCTPEELRGKTPVDLSPERQLDGQLSRDKAPVMIRNICSLGYWRFEWMHCSPHREPFPVEVIGRLMECEGRNVVVATWQDLSERKALEREKHRLIEILDRTTDFVGCADSRGQLGYHNPAAFRMVGLPPSTDLSTLRIDNMHPAWARELVMNVGLPIAREKGSWRGDSALLDSHGNEIPVRQTITVHRDPSGNVEFYSTIMHDISQLQASQREKERLIAELSHSNKHLEEFASLISHDLQTPLRNIRQFSGLLQRALKNESPEVKEWIDYIVSSVTRMTELVKDLLSFSKVTSIAPSEMESVDLNVLVRDVIRTDALKGQAEFMVHPLPVILGKASLLFQLFSNLFQNSIKYAIPGTLPKIEIVSEERPGEWQLTVKDQGKGIDAENLHLIFEIFHRVNPWDLQHGHGIGLAICRRVVESHGGRIWVESKPQQGAAFSFTLLKRGSN